MDYIRKENIEEGWYAGVCRNAGEAFWNGKKFMYLRFKFGWMWDTIEHFDDVKELRTDGFIPIQKIEKIKFDWKEIKELKHKIGY